MRDRASARSSVRACAFERAHSWAWATTATSSLPSASPCPEVARYQIPSLPPSCLRQGGNFGLSKAWFGAAGVFKDCTSRVYESTLFALANSLENWDKDLETVYSLAIFGDGSNRLLLAIPASPSACSCGRE